MNPPRILIVDDEPNIRFIWEHTLSHEGYILDSAADGAEALQKITQGNYDLLLLDLRMEPIDGLQVLREVRERDPDIVVIILTGYSSVESAVEALRLGAFDYLFKPAKPEAIRRRVGEGLLQRRQSLRRRHLLAQIEILRQALKDVDIENELVVPPAVSRRFIRSRGLVIDSHHRTTTLNGTLLDLTTTEFDLLLCLVKAAPQPVSAGQLMINALGYASETGEARDIVKWHIHHLRQKLEPDPAEPRYIKTVRHKGYLWTAGKPEA